MNTLLINASQPEEIRIALLNRDQHEIPVILNLEVEFTQYPPQKSNIFVGFVSSIEWSLEAVFINYGAERHGFLPFKEIASHYLNGKDRQSIKNAIKVGQKFMVQIKKEPRGNKGAALTTYITLPGSYLVLLSNNPAGGGVSRRIEGEERREMYEALEQLTVPEGMGLILRTAGVGRPFEALQTDLTLLLRQWEAILNAFQNKSAPCLIFQEGDVVARSIRDYLRGDIAEILVDEKSVFDKTASYVEQIRPDLLSKLHYYQESKPIFLQFGIEEAVKSVFQSELRLPAGGTLVFNRFEALVAIDINSGKSTQHRDIEETALKTNLEAAEMIAQQLRLRDLGGLIVIDFIDMVGESHKRQVENRVREATRVDRARIQIGRISSFGLLEMSRQRLRSSLSQANEVRCSHCQGHGTRRSIESLALAIIREIEKCIFQKTARQFQVQASLEIITYLGNEKRAALTQLEQKYKLKSVLLLANPYWVASRYEITDLDEKESVTTKADQVASYTLLATQPTEDQEELRRLPIAAEAPAVQGFLNISDSIMTRETSSIMVRFFRFLKRLICFKKRVPVSTVRSTNNNKPYVAGRSANRTSQNGNRRRNNRRRFTKPNLSSSSGSGLDQGASSLSGGTESIENPAKFPPKQAHKASGPKRSQPAVSTASKLEERVNNVASATPPVRAELKSPAKEGNVNSKQASEPRPPQRRFGGEAVLGRRGYTASRAKSISSSESLIKKDVSERGL